jgi:tRNA (cytidine/uridine-2'-O-)-methyltransferase
MNGDTTLFNIVLHNPEIPQNTGTIGRIAVETNCSLHLIEPLGFSLEDKYLKRAGLDYWPRLSPEIWHSWEDFLNSNPNAVMHFFSTHADTLYYDVEYNIGDYLVFGRESAGLPPEFYEKYRDRLRLIPMPGSFKRSINLACSVSAALYEAMRQTRSQWQNN